MAVAIQDARKLQAQQQKEKPSGQQPADSGDLHDYEIEGASATTDTGIHNDDPTVIVPKQEGQEAPLENLSAKTKNTLRQEGIFDINETNIDKKMKELDNLLGEIEQRKELRGKGLSDSKFTDYDITFALSSGQVAFRVAKKLDAIASKIKEANLGNEIKIRGVKSYAGKSDEVRRAFELGKNYGDRNTFQLPVMQDTDKIDSVKLAKNCVKNVAELLKFRSSDGLSTDTNFRPLRIKLPDGLKTSDKAAKILKKELVALHKEYGDALEVRIGDAKIDNKKSVFRDLMKRSQIYKVTLQNAKEIFKKVSERLTSNGNGQTQKRVKVQIPVENLDELRGDITELEIRHKRLKDTNPNYAQDNLTVDYYSTTAEGAASKVTPKSTTSSAFEQFDVDEFLAT